MSGAKAPDSAKDVPPQAVTWARELAAETGEPWQDADRPQIGAAPTTTGDQAPDVAPPTVFVGVGGTSVIMLATTRFDAAAFAAAKAVLDRFAAEGTRFRDVEAIVAEVRRDPTVSALEGAALARKAEADRVARERAESPIIHRFQRGDPLASPLDVKEWHIKAGSWQQLTDVSRTAATRGRARNDGDYELLTTIDGQNLSFHVHPPARPRGLPTPGAFMVGGRNPKQKQVPTEIVAAIVRLHGRPEAWDREDDRQWR